ncbi:hypothetical protein C8Q70DRAFT_912511 [Cubamyces menziesii]|nr:hypothetical protein C8Q70DRAFT_912511 [Cubamyces menziesii]
MKLSSLFLPALLCAASASAQYFSAGWSPGQPVPPVEPQGVPPQGQAQAAYDRAPTAVPTPEYTSTPPASGGATSGLGGLTSLFDVNRLLTSGPVASLFGRLGLNITDAVSRSAASPWDPRIPLLSDENFEEVVVREALTEEEERDRVWFIIVSVTAGGQNNALSQMVDQSFDEAFNRTVIAGDLPNVRWGRIDYLNVTYLTTKWSIWTGPYLIVLTDRGQTLRFYKADRVRVTPELLRELLTEELWRNTAPWKTNFAPGGKREWVMHYYALGLKRLFDFVNRFPRWMLMIASGAVASVVMRLLHSNPAAEVPTQPVAEPKDKVKDDQKTVVSQGSSTAVASTATEASANATASPSKGKKQRKNAKK